MSELENKIGIPGAVIEPSKAEQSATLQESINAHLAAGGIIDKPKPKPVNRREKRAASGKTSKRKSVKVLKSTGARKPVLTAWKMLCIKKGTKLTCRIDGKVSEKYFACTISEAGMNLDVTIKGRKKPTETDGLMRAEMLVRSILKKPVAKPQGWDFWGIEKKGKWVSIHSLFESTDRATLLNRRNY